MKNYFIGLLSGTSVDSVDCALVDFSDSKPMLIATHKQDYPPKLQQALHDISEHVPSVITTGQLDRQVGEVFGEAVNQLLARQQLQASDITAIGSHGQNIHHAPHGETPFTWQIGDPNTIASYTNITTVADFRRKDIALGGQGAPLTPRFHQLLFQHKSKGRAIVNIGGIVNITWLPQDGADVIGFDSGPGNTLLDCWIRKHTTKIYDHDGMWAASGSVNHALLTKLLADPYFKQPYPKSTGREYFNLGWLENHLSDEPDADIQATLVELTAVTIADAINQLPQAVSEVFVCGGGAHNAYLMTRIAHCLEHLSVHSTNELGIDPDWIEAMAFAWFAKQTLERQPCSLPAVTGASRASVLGGIYYP